MDLASQFPSIIVPQAPLGERTCFRVGGAAEMLARPTSPADLTALIRASRAANVPWRVFGGGSNILVPDEGVRGLVIELSAPAFREVRIEGTRATLGGGLLLAEGISATCQAGLSGLEILVGVPGTVGGAICKNAGGRSGDIGPFVHSIELVDGQGTMETRQQSQLRFGYRSSNLDDCVIVSATLELLNENAEDLVRRIKKIWIERQGHQPDASEHAGYAFRNPRGMSALELIDKAGLRGAKVGKAELSHRDPCYVVAQPGASSRDVRQLIELVLARVEEETGFQMELQVDLW
jgi:UDP-N-acetylmuramate dehydrogenase